MPSETPTPWAVHCRGIDDPEIGAGPCTKGLVFLTQEEYMNQMRMPNRTWRCPNCGSDAWWDDDNYEKHDTLTQLQDQSDKLRDELKQPEWEGSTVREIALSIIAIMDGE